MSVKKKGVKTSAHYDVEMPATKNSSVYQSKYHPCAYYTLGISTSTILPLLAEYNKEKDAALIENTEEFEKLEARDPKFSKGQSKRIWNELYKVTCFHATFFYHYQ